MSYKFDPMGFLASSILFLLPFLIYGQSLGYPLFFLDDNAYFWLNPVVQDGNLQGLADAWSRFQFGYTPITHLTIWIDKFIGIDGLWFSRLHTLAWFGLGVLGVRAMITHLTGSAKMGFCVALLYAVHPLCTPSCAWLALRRQVVSLAFLWWALALFLNAIKNSQQLNQRAYIGSIMLASGAMLSRFQAVVAAPIMLAMIWIQPVPLMRRMLLIVPVATTAVIFTVVSLIYADESSICHYRLAGGWSGTILVDGEILAKYLLMTVWPCNLTIYYGVTERISSPWPSIMCWLAVACVFSIMVIAAKRRPLVAVCIASSLAALFPTMNLVNQTYAMADHYLQPALPFIICAALITTQDVFRRLSLEHLAAKWSSVATVSAATLLAATSWARTPSFSSELVFLHQAVQASPSAGFWWAYLSRRLKMEDDPVLRLRSQEATATALNCHDTHRVDSTTFFRTVHDGAAHLIRLGQYPQAIALVESYRYRQPDLTEIMVAMLDIEANQPDLAVKRLWPRLSPEHWIHIERNWVRYDHGRAQPRLDSGWGNADSVWGITDALDASQAKRVWQVTALITLAEALVRCGDHANGAKITLACLHRFPRERQSWLLLAEALNGLGLESPASKALATADSLR